MMPVTVSGTITDTGCSIKSASFTVTDEYGKIQPKGTVTPSVSGAYSFGILLQASRLGSDKDGRRYSITVVGSDNAGNSGSKTTVVTVSHDQGY
jgi:type 1 fimbria pilin